MAVDEFHARAMASDVQVIVVDGPPQAWAKACRALDELESIWSRFVESSDTNRLNHRIDDAVSVAQPTLTLVEAMVEGWRMTDGRFDPTILPALVDAGYVTSIDDPTARTSLLENPPTAGWAGGTEKRSFGQTEVNRRDRTITLPPGVAIDPGGIGKGLAADLVVAELLASGAKGALVNIGGDLAMAGTAPSTGGWPLAVEDPIDTSKTLTRLTISGGGVATSSTLSRQWVHHDERQHHVIDPTTGNPSDTDLVSVTVVAACGWQAEVHATAILLGGQASFDHYVRTNELEALATAASGETIVTATVANSLAKADAP